MSARLCRVAALHLPSVPCHHRVFVGWQCLWEGVNVWVECVNRELWGRGIWESARISDWVWHIVRNLVDGNLSEDAFHRDHWKSVSPNRGISHFERSRDDLSYRLSYLHFDHTPMLSDAMENIVTLKWYISNSCCTGLFYVPKVTLDWNSTTKNMDDRECPTRRPLTIIQRVEQSHGLRVSTHAACVYIKRQSFLTTTECKDAILFRSCSTTFFKTKLPKACLVLGIPLGWEKPHYSTTIFIFCLHGIDCPRFDNINSEETEIWTIKTIYFSLKAYVEDWGHDSSVGPTCSLMLRMSQLGPVIPAMHTAVVLHFDSNGRFDPSPFFFSGDQVGA